MVNGMSIELQPAVAGERKKLREEIRYFVGLDVGQVHDSTAIAVAERTDIEYEEWDRVTYDRKRTQQYSLRHLQRLPLGMAYPDQADAVAELLERSPLHGNCELIVDATGVGAPIVDLIRKAARCPVHAVVITSGDSQRENDGRFSVPKRDLVSGVAVLLEQRLLAIAQSVPLQAEFFKELMNFRVKISNAGHDSYGSWREGMHDDLVLAVSLAVWRSRGRQAGRLGGTRPVLSL
jgi:hypothetical protein